MKPTPSEQRPDTVWVDLLKILLTVGIVLRHATLEQASRPIVLLTEVCVPLFFALSGYLFFFRVPERPGFRWFTDKWKKRVLSLLVPYLIANLVAFAFYWLAGRYAPGMVSGFFGDRLKDPFFVLWTGPVNLSLWFIRDLLIAVLCAPVIYLLVRFGGWWTVLAFGLLWFFGAQTPWNNFFFTLGAFLAVHRKDVAEHCGKSGPFWLLAAAGAFTLALKEGGHATSLYVLAGLPVCVWGASRLVQACRLSIAPTWRAWCFFLYLYHYLPLIGIKKWLFQALAPQSDAACIAVYLGAALTVLLLLSGLYVLLRKLLPRVTRVLVGGK